MKSDFKFSLWDLEISKENINLWTCQWQSLSKQSKLYEPSKWFKNHLPNIKVVIGILKRKMYLFKLFPMVHKCLTLCPWSFPSVSVSKWCWELWPLLPAPNRAEPVQNTSTVMKLDNTLQKAIKKMLKEDLKK